MINNDERLVEARAIPIEEIADRLGLEGLKRAGRERVGPCPACGGSDRFAINLDRNLYNCRSCGGGDGIRLVKITLGCEFRAALDYLVGAAPVALDPAEAARRRARSEAEARRRAAAAETARVQAIALARALWAEGLPPEDTPVRAYLSLRGIARAALPEIPAALRFHPALRYTVFEEGAWQVIHEGPAMLAGVLGPGGDLIGCHRTWLDLARPSGKAAIVHKGDEQVAKKMLGSKKGGAIRLARGTVPVLVMGEGIETTLSAQVAAAIPGAAYWAGVDLGNMAGRRLPVLNPATGRTSTRASDRPDMDDADAFLPPLWFERLVFIQDGDSAPDQTRSKLLAGLRRAMAVRPGLVGTIVHAGEGVDLNDVIRRQA